MIIGNDIHALISYHTHGEILLYPWAYSLSVTAPDDLYLQSVGQEITSRITKQYGSGTYTPQQAGVLYPTTGDTRDWSYGYSHYILGRPTFSFTVEACDTFHPSESYLQQVVEENYDGAFYLLEEAENISNVIPRVLPPVIDDMFFDADGTYQISWTEGNPDANPDLFQLDELTGSNIKLDDAETGSGYWNLDGFSLDDTEAFSGTYSYKSRYLNNDVSSMTSVFPLYVDNDMNLSFWCWYDTEVEYDYAFVEVSREGRYYEILDEFNGDSSGWVYKEYNLDEYYDESIYIRFRYITDPNTQGTGFYVDDIYPILDFSMISVLSDTIVDDYLDIVGRLDGIYYYRVKGHNSEHDWCDYSTLERVIVGETNISTHVTELKQNWNFLSLPFSSTVEVSNVIVKYNDEYYNWSEATTGNNPTGNPLVDGSIFGWDRTNQTYSIGDVLVAGEGYWMYSYQECEKRVIGLYSGLTGLITNCEQNWNIIGIPNDVGIMKTSMIVEFNDTDYAWTDATTSNNPTGSPLIDSSVFGWDKTNQTYNNALSLEPGEAYWLYSYQSCTLK
jgi:hypothetical protein